MRSFILYFYLLASFSGMGQAITFGTLGNGFDSYNYYKPVRTLFYDTIDKKLYASGQFSQAENKTVWGVAVWHNNAWDSLKGGFAQFPQQQPAIFEFSNNRAWSIVRFQNKIYFAGHLDYVNGELTCCMGVWNGTGWEPPMTQLPNAEIQKMVVYNNNLYACGLFTKFGTVTCNYVAKFDGISWQPVGDLTKLMKTYTPAQMNSLEFYNNELYIGGAFDDSTGTPKNIAKFDGTNWLNVGTGIEQGGINYVYSMTTFNNRLVIGGRFSHTSQIPGIGLISWDGLNYHGFGADFFLQNGEVNFFEKFGNKLIVGGAINNTNVPSVINVFYVDSNNNPCGISGMDSTFTHPNFYAINACAVMGDSLILGGQFKRIGLLPVNNIGFVRNFQNNPNCLYVGVNENKFEKNSVKIYPNPINDKLNVEFVETNLKNEKLEILNSLGQSVYVSNSDTQKQVIDLSSLPSGVYFLKIQSETQIITHKIIKQ